jgi:hypothetical protein
MGGIVTVSLQNGEAQNTDVLGKFREPRGIALSKGRLAFSTESSVFVLDGNKLDTIEHEWFSYIHTVDFSPTKSSKILISSSGYDCIFEFDIITKEKSFEWFAWEHGFNKGKDPVTGKSVILTRKADEAMHLEAIGDDFIEIKDPKTDVLPTAKRAAFINSVVYDTTLPDTVLATFFHEGSVYRINMRTGMTEKIISGLQKPHGAKNYGDSVMVTSTGSGEVLVASKESQSTYLFSNLEGKPTFLKDMEWVQNTICMDSCLVGIDSNRTTFVVFDPNRRLYDTIPYDSNWAIQDGVIGSINNLQKDKIRQIASGLD